MSFCASTIARILTGKASKFWQLAPSQDVEKAGDVAGLSSDNSQSMLRLLTQERIGTLPDQWKIVTTRHAISLLIYQQSMPLLELLRSRNTGNFFWKPKPSPMFKQN
jgi:hypothetical protein